MRKYLLAGTSVVALALTAGVANAQSAPGKFDVKMSGDAYFEAGATKMSKDYAQTAGANTHTNGQGDFINRFRLTINPEAKSDNGLTYGANVRIRANAADGRVDGDRAYIYMSGAGGSVQAGVTAGPSDNTFVGHPMDWQLLGAYDQWKYYTQSSTTTTANSTSVNGTGSAGRGGSAAWAWGQFGNGSSASVAAPASEGMQLLHSHDIDTKLVYYTPRFLGKTPTTGLQGAVSYAPHVGDGQNGGVSVNTAATRSPYAGSCVFDSNVGALATAANITAAITAGSCQQTTAFRDAYEVALNYSETFGKWMVKASAGYEGGTAERMSATDINTYKGLKSVQLGAQVGYGDFVLGGGVVDNFRSGYRKRSFNIGDAAQDGAADMTSWNVGVQYTFGPAVLGVKYLSQTDAGDLATKGNRQLKSITGGGMYTIAPGLRAGLEYTYFDAKSDMSLDSVRGALTSTAVGATGDGKQSGNVLLARTVVSF